MIKEVFYINEAQSLRQALNVCLKTHHQLLVVVNNFEEISGLISLEDIVGQILGQKIVDEFDQYDDLKVVAGIEVYKSKKSSTHGTV